MIASRGWTWALMIIWSSHLTWMNSWPVSALFYAGLSPAAHKYCALPILSLDTGTRQASRGDRVISLTAKEYELLELFMRHPRQVLTRDMIFDRVWGYDFGGESNIIEVYIRYLRQKLELNEETAPDPYRSRDGLCSA